MLAGKEGVGAGAAPHKPRPHLHPVGPGLRALHLPQKPLPHPEDPPHPALPGVGQAPAEDLLGEKGGEVLLLLRGKKRHGPSLLQ